MSFLVDTGANVSVIPRRNNMQIAPTLFNLYAANNTTIPTYGEKIMELDLKLRRPYKWKFIVAAVSKPILGADFLRHHNLIVDLKGSCLIDRVTNLSVQAPLHLSSVPTVRTIDANAEYHDILAEFPDIMRPSAMKESPKHNVEHVIETTGQPLYARARPLPPHRYNSVKKEFEYMMQQGLCQPSKSPWASPLHVVPKPNGDLRVCGDYRRLNSVTKPDRYPIPRLRDFTYQLQEKTTFSTLDLNRAYQQLRVAEQDVEKTAIITPFGLYEFPRMPPGLRNAGQTFQRFIHQVLRDLDFVFPFIDDLLIASANEEEHRHHLRTVLQQLDKYGITINPSKCVLGKPEVTFLGYSVSQYGIKPPKSKIQAIIDYPKPTCIEELRRFLGMMNFYREHIPTAAAIQAPLNAYLHNAKKRDKTEIKWHKESEMAFEACKASIQSAALLAHPSFSAPLALMCDASDRCAGAVLQQQVDNAWQPLGYFSKKFSDTQQRYSTYDRELLSIYMAVKHFRKMFEGREMVIYTDHKPLTFAIAKPPSDNDTPRRIRQLLFISEFTTDIRHISGKNNTVADALSRIETITCPTAIDYAQLAAAQERDSEIPNLLQRTNIILKRMTLPNSDAKVYCEVSTPNIRPYLTEQYRHIAFNALHDISHPGTRATRKLMQQKYFWPSMNQDIGNWTRTCIPCQKSKIHRHTSSEVASFPPNSRFAHIHIDIVGPLCPASQGQRYLLTVIDRETRWPEAFPIEEITAVTIARTLYEGWIARYGCPSKLTSDQGRQFESNLFHALTKLMGIKKIRTTPYHPQSNGVIERWHRTLKAALMARLRNNKNWIDELPTVLLGLRAAIRSDTGVSPAELAFGRPLRLPGDFFIESKEDNVCNYTYVDQLRQKISEYRSVPTQSHASSRSPFVHPDLSTCEQVFLRIDAVRKPLQAPYEGPYPVLKRNSKTFEIQMPSRIATVSIDRLKPAYMLREETCTPPRTNSNSTQRQDVSQQPAPRTTRCGRVIKAPVRFA